MEYKLDLGWAWRWRATTSLYMSEVLGNGDGWGPSGPVGQKAGGTTARGDRANNGQSPSSLLRTTLRLMMRKQTCRVSP